MSQYEIQVTRHGYYQCARRGIDSDNLEKIIKNSELHIYGKHGVKFVCKGRKTTIICVGEKICNRIKIFTVEVKR